MESMVGGSAGGGGDAGGDGDAGAFYGRDGVFRNICELPRHFKLLR